MCGACGRDNPPDPVFPAGRNTRDQMIAAQMITQLCEGLPAAVKVVGRAEGFSVAAAGHHWTLCATVRDVWSAIDAVTPTHDVLNDVPGSLTVRYIGEPERRLFEALIKEGRRSPLRGSGPA